MSFGKGKSEKVRVCSKKEMNNDSDSDSTIIAQPGVSESHHDHTDVTNNNDEVPLHGTESTTKYDTPT